MGAASQRAAPTIRQSAQPQGGESCSFAWLPSALRVGWDWPRHAGLPAPRLQVWGDLFTSALSEALSAVGPGEAEPSRVVGLSVRGGRGLSDVVAVVAARAWSPSPCLGGGQPHRGVGSVPQTLHADCKPGGQWLWGSVEKGRGAPFANTVPPRESGRKDRGLCPRARPRRGRPYASQAVWVSG